MGLFKEFKAFAMRGNVVDMAVGIIIGGALGKIVSSLVADVIMPPVGLLLGGVNFAELSVTLKEGTEAVTSAAGEVTAAVPAVTVNYGTFVQVVLDFVIVAFSIFMVIKAMNRMKKKEEAAPAPAAPPEPPADVKLLGEIRDLLKK